MKYIRDLEAAGFRRDQAEAQVQMVLDAIEGDLMTKSDFAVFQEQTKNQMAQFQQSLQTQIQTQLGAFANQMTQSKQETQSQIKELELRLTIKLGVLTVSVASISIAILTWLIKI